MVDTVDDCTVLKSSLRCLAINSGRRGHVLSARGGARDPPDFKAGMK